MDTDEVQGSDDEELEVPKTKRDKGKRKLVQADADWVEDGEMQPWLRAKLLSLKTCRNRCLVNASSEDALTIAKPVMNMFNTLVQFGGGITADSQER